MVIRKRTERTQGPRGEETTMSVEHPAARDKDDERAKGVNGQNFGYPLAFHILGLTDMYLST